MAERAAADGVARDLRALDREVDRMVRLAACDAAVRRRSPAEALPHVDPEAPEAERGEVASMLATLPADVLAEALVELLAQGVELPVLVAGVLVDLARTEPTQAGGVLEGVLRRLPAGATLDGDTRRLRAVLAAAAAWRDDVVGVIGWADADADWVWLDARLGTSAATPAGPRTRTLLAALADGPASAAHVAHALADIAGALPLPARRRAASLGLATVRRAFGAPSASIGTLESAARTTAALRVLWRVAPPAGDARAFAALLGVPVDADGVGSASPAMAPALDAARVDPANRRDAVARVVATLRTSARSDDACAREVDAWVAALVADALSAAGPGDAVQALDAAAGLVAQAVAERVTDADAPARLGALLRAALPDGAPGDAAHAVGWQALIARADPSSAQQLALRMLIAAARPGPDGGIRPGAFAEACAAAVRTGVTLDDAALQQLGDALGDAFVAAPATAMPTLELTLAALGTLVDGARAAALAQRVGARAAPPLRDALRLRRLAAAVGEIERARDERTYAELCALLRDGAADALRPADAMLLRVYLGVSTGPLLARARSAWQSLRDAAGGRTGTRS